MSEYALKAEVRADRGKEKARKLRQKGQFPAIVYGAGEEPMSLTLAVRETELVIQRTLGQKVLVELGYGEKSDKVFIRNIQRDPVSNRLLHIDFYRVDVTKEITTAVPVIPIGEPLGVKSGGVLETLTREIGIRCLPTDVPPYLEVNVEHLDIGKTIQVFDLPKVPGVTYTGAPETVIFLVAGKTKEEEVLVATSATAAAPAAAAPAAPAP